MADRTCLLTFSIDSRVGRRRAAVTDVFTVKVVVRVPVQVLLVAAADKVAAGHDAFLDATPAASFNTPGTSFNIMIVYHAVSMQSHKRNAFKIH